MDCRRPVMAYLLRRADRETAIDVAAETFLVAWRRIDDIPEGDQARLWLYGVARRVLANQRRSRGRFRSMTERVAGAGADPVPTPETVVVRRAEDGNTDGLADPSVHAIELAPDGTLWVGSDSGVYVYDPSTDMFLSVDD